MGNEKPEEDFFQYSLSLTGHPRKPDTVLGYTVVVKRNRTQIQISCTLEAYSECRGEEGHKDNQLLYKVEDDKGVLAEGGKHRDHPRLQKERTGLASASGGGFCPQNSH